MPLIEVVAPIVTSPPAVTVPFTTVFVVCMSSDVALECTPEKRPPPLPDASTDDRSVAPAFTTTFPVAMSCAPVSIVIVVSVVSDVCASASPTDTSPPPPLDVFAPTRPRLSVVMLIVPAWIEAPEPIVFVKIGWTTAFAFADFTSIAPPLEPDDDAVATWSPVGAPASTLLPPTPSSCCTPLPVEVRSTMRYCRPEPAAVMFTPSAANVCVPIAPVREPEVMSIGAPPGVSASWNVVPVWLRA